MVACRPVVADVGADGDMDAVAGGTAGVRAGERVAGDEGKPAEGLVCVDPAAQIRHTVGARPGHEAGRVRRVGCRGVLVDDVGLHPWLGPRAHVQGEEHQGGPLGEAGLQVTPHGLEGPCVAEPRHGLADGLHAPLGAPRAGVQVQQVPVGRLAAVRGRTTGSAAPPAPAAGRGRSRASARRARPPSRGQPPHGGPCRPGVVRQGAGGAPRVDQHPQYGGGSGGESQRVLHRRVIVGDERR